MNYFNLFCLFLIFISSSLSIATDKQDQCFENDKKILQNTFKDNPTIYGITEDQLDDLFETSADYVVLLNETQYQRVNEKWTERLGWTAKELLSKPFLWLIHPEDVETTKDAAYKGSNVSCVINYKNRCLAKNGDYHLIEWLTLFQVAGSNQFSPILAIGKDLTLEEKFKSDNFLLEEAKTATRIKSNFVAYMSHEIRTPLNGIMLFLNLALEEQMSKQLHDYVQNAQESSCLLLNVANDIIDVSKIESDTLKIEQEDFNPYSAINAVLSLLNLQAQKKGLTLKSSIDSNLPYMLKGDINRLKQILINLISNAIKFTSKGEVFLRIKGKFQVSSPEKFMFQGKVKDTGIGIEDTFRTKLFKPFSQEDDLMKRQFDGVGLGLYITKQLCERMGGTINMLSTPGEGSTFQFYVIFEQSILKPLNIIQSSPCVITPVTEQLPGYKILLVEDNLMNQKVATILLKRLGCEVDLAENGQLGYEAVYKKSYDLVLMDGEMPVMDGLEATRRIRKDFSMEKLPIIGVSAHAMTTHREQFLKSGMNGYVSKPINKQILMEEIIRCMQKD